jgi:lipid II isoglutaminyl synthase (glutamine-hydrolysing)
VSLLAPKVAAAKAIGVLTRRAGRGGGTSLPGKLLTRLEPHAIGLLAGRLEHGNVVISATNGKTTTAAMVASILERSGRRLVHNRAGANMAGGVASALADASRRGGRALDGDFGLFEVDEFWLGEVVEELNPRAMLLANLFRDQLDRYGELDTIADRWAVVAAERAASTQLVLNADDPLVADLGRVPNAEPWYFGVEDDSVAHKELQHASDSKHCRRCGHAYVYEAAYMGHLGRYHCPHCGNRRPEPAVAAESVQLRGIRSAAFTLRAPQGSTLCLSLGVELPTIAAGLGAVEPAFGRAETIELDGRPTSILLVKNPAGANEVLRTLALEGGELDLFGVLNDRIADGRDVSWVWDADWETLAPHVARMTCSGTRAAELALRLKYAGVPVERLHVVEDLASGLDHALGGGERSGDEASGRGRGPLYALPTYTALLELRGLLSERGAAREYWR